ncbi:hypothetical protein D1007_39664 [Hordeum vulgare]|nr:hypothetical protein D1007_39664 [Hordeum vulgare]
MLFQCNKAKEVWRKFGMESIIQSGCMVDHEGEAVLEHLLSLPADETQVLGERKAENFAAVSDKCAKGKRNPWTRLPPGYTKLNVDASFDPDLLQGTVGTILRDNAGKFIAASNYVVDVCFDMFKAEALALRFGLNLAMSVGCNKLIVNPDNTDVIASMQEGGNSSGTTATILDDCYHMARDFTHVRYDRCHREANSVADKLARICKFSSPNSWFDEPPSVIIPLVVRDNVLIIS